MSDPPRTATAAHPRFRRSVAAFGRLGVAVRPAPAPGAAGDAPSDAGVAYGGVAAAIRGADSESAALLEDASLLDRCAYALGLFAPLLRAAAAAGEPVSHPASAGGAGTLLAIAPSVRVVRTRWDWDAFLADPGLGRPSAAGAAWALHLPPAGPVQEWRLHPLPALLLEACEHPVRREQAVAAVVRRVADAPGQLASLLHAQVDELCASGLIRPLSASDGTVEEMQQLLLGEPAPAPALNLAGMLSRAVRSAQAYADDARTAADDPHALHLVDVMVNLLDGLLGRARVRGAFAAELDGYWAGETAPARIRSAAPLLQVLGAVLASGALPPYVIP